MLEQSANKNFKDLLIKYVFEIMVIFLGISISFWFDEWRDNRRDRELESKHLIDLKSNLQQDTFQLLGQGQMGAVMANSARKLAIFRKDSEILDSLDVHIDNATSYVALKTNKTAYEEIKQTGHTSLITNDSLKTFILQYYTIVIPYAEEWGEIDKHFTMSQIIPEMSNYFPVVLDTTNMVSASAKIKVLKVQKMRNLLLTDATYKQETIRVFNSTKIYAAKLIKRIEKELNK